MTASLAYIRAAMGDTPWAITPGRLEAIATVIERRAAGGRLAAEDIAALKGDRAPNGLLMLADGLAANDARAPGKSTAGGGAVGVITIAGIVAQHAHQVDSISGPGGTSTERVGASFRTALADPNIGAIVLNIDSPGGNVYGVMELADQIHAARGQKPIIAQVNSLAASAAYWIASAADEIVVTPSGEVGSIGVYGLHQDVSTAAEKAGVRFTFISAGKFKTEGNPYEPLTDESTAAMQSAVDGYYADFVRAVARGRKTTIAAVRDGFGQGRVVRAQDAVKLGMADSVGTMEATLRRLGAGRAPAAARAAASAGPDELLTDAAAETPIAAEAVAAAIEGDAVQASEQALALTVANDAEAARLAHAADLDAFRRRRHAHRMRSA